MKSTNYVLVGQKICTKEGSVDTNGMNINIEQWVFAKRVFKQSFDVLVKINFSRWEDKLGLEKLNR